MGQPIIHFPVDAFAPKEKVRVDQVSTIKWQPIQFDCVKFASPEDFLICRGAVVNQRSGAGKRFSFANHLPAAETVGRIVDCFGVEAAKMFQRVVNNSDFRSGKGG